MAMDTVEIRRGNSLLFAIALHIMDLIAVQVDGVISKHEQRPPDPRGMRALDVISVKTMA